MDTPEVIDLLVRALARYSTKTELAAVPLAAPRPATTSDSPAPPQLPLDPSLRTVPLSSWRILSFFSDPLSDRIVRFAKVQDTPLFHLRNPQLLVISHGRQQEGIWEMSILTRFGDFLLA